MATIPLKPVSNLSSTFSDVDKWCRSGPTDLPESLFSAVVPGI